MRHSWPKGSASITEASVTEPQSTDGMRTGRWVTLATLVATTAVWMGFLLVQLFGVHSNDLGYLDLLVYRAGGHAVITGHSIYAADFAAVNQSPNGLSFTYPPFSAVIFAPLAIVPAGSRRC